jgi:hypothetical protein
VRRVFYLITYGALGCLRIANARGAYFGVLTMLFLLSAFRFEVGCDWTGYLNQYFTYQPVTFFDLLSEREPFWIGLFVVQHWLGLPYPWINVASSAIFFYGAHFLARRQPDPLGFLVLLFPILVINMPMSGIRQAAAIGIMCIAFVAFVDRRPLRFITLTVLAGSLHSSAILFVLLTPLVKGEFSKRSLLLSGLLAVPGTLVLLSTGGAEQATSRYIETGIDAAGAVFRVGLLTITGLAYLLVLRREWAMTFPKDYKLVTVGSLIMLCLLGVVGISTVIGDRLGYYLIPIQVMALARLPDLPSFKGRATLIFTPYVALWLVLATWTTLSPIFEKCYLPYQTWLFGFPSARYFF